jgi:4a-hydroxytetrahydrobiopterin dehydratase
MGDLATRSCEPCREGSPPLGSAQSAELLRDLPGWQVRREAGVPMLVRTFRCADFADALALANAIGQVADAEDHHPRLVVEWGRVEVAWWTHVIRGLHLNDFILAARTDSLAAARREAGRPAG